jgi:hypothetical protein
VARPPTTTHSSAKIAKNGMRKKKKTTNLSGPDQARFQALRQKAERHRYQLSAKPDQFVVFSGSSPIGVISRLDGRSTDEHLNDLSSLLRPLLPN